MKLASEACTFPFRDRHKGIKQGELADLSFKPCGKIFFASGRGSISQRRKKMLPLNLFAFLPHRASDHIKRGVLARMRTHTTAAGKGTVASRKKCFSHSALVILGRALFRCF